jgi:hypothetical protein
MKEFTNKLALLIGTILTVDLLIPRVGLSELIFQAVLVGVCGVLTNFRL